MIVGITGTIGAGKGTVVEILKEKGFKHFSAREFITQEILRRGLIVNRDSMVIVANSLREKYGPSYVAEELFKRAKATGQNAVIESLRTVGEIEALRANGNFVLLAIDANPELRYERVYKRGNETDNISFEQFVSEEEREFISADPAKQNLSACMELADHILINDGSYEDLKKKVEGLLK
ncbi:MAG: AAA family ATPase [Candidatus Nanoarchaeia archaeon]